MAINPYHIIDHVSRALDKPTSPFQGCDNIEAVIAAIVEEFQELEGVFYTLIYDRFLENATGDALDIIGAIVGESRSGLTDELFRGYIRARVQVNLSNGEPERLITIVKLIVNGSLVRYSPVYPAGVIMAAMTALELTDEARERIYRTLESALPAGVQLVGFVDSPVGYFGFDDDDDALGFDEGMFSEVTYGL